MKSSTLLVTLLLVPSMLFVGPQAAEAAALYAEDFETWSVGAYPSPPWANIFPGVSAFVTDLQARSGSKSFRSESNPGSARWDYVQMASIPDLVEYRGSVFLESAGRGCFLGFGYRDPDSPGTGWLGNSVWFSNDGVIRFYSRGLPAPDLGTWLPGRWYDVHVVIDYLTLRADVYIDGVLVGADLQAAPKIILGYSVPVPLDKFGFFGDNFPGAGTGVHFLDGVQLEGTDLPVAVESDTWAGVKGLYR
jgi:hypothetical protein